MVHVVAGILEREGRILVGRRKPTQSHPLKWEFPGGKVEPGESPEQALGRELEEELGIERAAGSEIMRYHYTYPGKNPILLIFFRVTAYRGEPQNLVFHEMEWRPRDTLGALEFVEGDTEFIRALPYTVPMATAIKMVEPSENEFLASLEAKNKRPNYFLRTMAQRPEVLKNFPPLYGAIMGPGPVDRRTKELVYLTASFANQCPYCTAAHIASGRKAGITEEDLQALQSEQNDRFTPPEQAAIRYARELTRTAKPGHAREALAPHFNEEQIVEITLIAAMANFTNRFNNGLAIMPEEPA